MLITDGCRMARGTDLGEYVRLNMSLLHVRESKSLRGGRGCHNRIRLWMVCCAGWLGRSVPDWGRLASGSGAMCLTVWALGVAWRDII